MSDSQKFFIKAQNPRSSWLEEEDAKLIELVGIIGERNWALIAQELPGRVGKQCRERWRNHLNPNIRHDPFSEEEDQTIIRLVQELGTRWARISELMEGRTENSIKNRYYCFLKAKVESHSRKRTKAATTAELTPPPVVLASDSDVEICPSVADCCDLPLPKAKRLAVKRSLKKTGSSRRTLRSLALGSPLDQSLSPTKHTKEEQPIVCCRTPRHLGIVSINDLITHDQEDSVPSAWSAAVALCALRHSS